MRNRTLDTKIVRFFRYLMVLFGDWNRCRGKKKDEIHQDRAVRLLGSEVLVGRFEPGTLGALGREMPDVVAALSFPGPTPGVGRRFSERGRYP